MGKKAVPRGCIARRKCKCGRYYTPTSQNKFQGCTVCFVPYREDKK